MNRPRRSQYTPRSAAGLFGIIVLVHFLVRWLLAAGAASFEPRDLAFRILESLLFGVVFVILSILLRRRGWL